jgi:hypothetical protein
LSSLKKLLSIKEMISEEELSEIKSELSFLPDDERSLLLNYMSDGEQESNYTKKQYNIARLFGLMTAFSNLFHEVTPMFNSLTPE